MQEPQHRPAKIMIMEIRDIFIFLPVFENGVVNSQSIDLFEGVYGASHGKFHG